MKLDREVRTEIFLLAILGDEELQLLQKYSYITTWPLDFHVLFYITLQGIFFPQ